MEKHYDSKETKYTYKDLVRQNRKLELENKKLKLQHKLSELESSNNLDKALMVFIPFLVLGHEFSYFALAIDPSNKVEMKDFIYSIILSTIAAGVSEIFPLVFILKNNKKIKSLEEEIKANEEAMIKLKYEDSDKEKSIRTKAKIK